MIIYCIALLNTALPTKNPCIIQTLIYITMFHLFIRKSFPFQSLRSLLEKCHYSSHQGLEIGEKIRHISSLEMMLSDIQSQFCDCHGSFSHKNYNVGRLVHTQIKQMWMRTSALLVLTQS